MAIVWYNEYLKSLSRRDQKALILTNWIWFLNYTHDVFRSIVFVFRVVQVIINVFRRQIQKHILMGSTHGVLILVQIHHAYFVCLFIRLLAHTFVCLVVWSFHCHLSRYDFGVVRVCFGFCNTIRCLFRTTSLGWDDIYICILMNE